MIGSIHNSISCRLRQNRSLRSSNWYGVYHDTNRILLFRSRSNHTKYRKSEKVRSYLIQPLQLCKSVRCNCHDVTWRITKTNSTSLIDEGGDWDRRNRLKVYEGIHRMSIRDFKGAVALLLDSLATFTSTEMMEYKDFVKYTVLTAAITLPRPELKKKVSL